MVRKTGRSRPAGEDCAEWIEPAKSVLARVVGPRRSVSPPPSTPEPDAPFGVPATESCEPGWVSRKGLNRHDPAMVQTARLQRYRNLRGRLVDEVTVVTPQAVDGAAPYGVGVLAPDVERRNDAYVQLRSRGRHITTRFGSIRGPPRYAAGSSSSRHTSRCRWLRSNRSRRRYRQ